MNKIYSVKDVCSGTFYPPQIYKNDNLAIRSFDLLLKDSSIASDLQLYYLGEFNEETGEIVSDVKFIKGGNNA